MNSQRSQSPITGPSCWCHGWPSATDIYLEPARPKVDMHNFHFLNALLFNLPGCPATPSPCLPLSTGFRLRLDQEAVIVVVHVPCSWPKTNFGPHGDQSPKMGTKWVFLYNEESHVTQKCSTHKLSTTLQDANRSSISFRAIEWEHCNTLSQFQASLLQGVL